MNASTAASTANAPPDPPQNDANPARRVLDAIDASLAMVGHAWGRTERLIKDIRRDASRVGDEWQALGAASRASWTAFRDGAQATPRTLTAATRLLRIMASYRVHQARAAQLSDADAAAAITRLHQLNADRAAALCAEAGGALLKVGQLLSCRADILPTAYIHTLSRLQDDVAAAPFEAIQPVIEDALGAPLDAIYASVDPSPLASASLAQVHTATRQDGVAVVIKVQRPEVPALVRGDMAVLRLLRVALKEMAPDLPIGVIASEVERSLREELDFSREAQAFRAAREQVAHRDDVVVPWVDDARSADRVITMQHIDGVRFGAYLQACAADGEAGAQRRDALFGVLIETFCEQILIDGVFHADPHPGNFLVLPSPTRPRLALLDFGSVGRLTDRERLAYAQAAGAILAGDVTRIAAVLSDMGFAAADGDAQGLELLAEMLRDQIRMGLSDPAAIDPAAELARAVALLRDHPIAIVPTSFVMVGRVLASLGGLVLHHQPRVDLLRAFTQAVSKARAAAAAQPGR